ncbi:hypothetical protein CUJ83_00790 [Methanocella sp. CWC-04]|uniref:histidine kinase n=1 Tax=Methanooceanicella nereidis TaxID=2052831 RepID=A0AAP2W4R4_9EURY|nr:ATP-binding protein [Methanocella sp. CWC-04]MCD1293532.1 hypothetical protein [Methanocella sp. CWC-04]
MPGKNYSNNIIKFLLIATTATILINAILLLLPTSISIFYETIQFLWPVLCIILLANIYHSSQDKNIRHLSLLYAIALIPWTLTILLWEVLLPIFFYNDLAYYITGFGFLVSYAIIAYGLYRLKNSKQWYIQSSPNHLINFIAIILAISAIIFVLVNLSLDDPRLIDIITLLTYIMGDIVILSLCSKLIVMNLKADLKYIIIFIAGFVFINSIADTLFLMRWILPMKYIFSFKVSLLTDVIYTVSLIFLTVALLVYNTDLKNRALAEIRKKLDDNKIFIDNMIAHSPDPMCVWDRSGNIMLINDPFLKIFDTKRADIIGKFNLFEHAYSMDKELSDKIKNVANGNSLFIPKMKICLSKNNGHDRHVSLKIFPIYDSYGEITSYVSNLDDITERLRTEEELLDSKLQNEFYLDLMTHDINNMNQIGMGFLELADDIIEREGSLGKDNSILIGRPMEAFRNSSRLIENVRKIQKVKNKDLAFEKFDINNVLEEVKNDHKDIQGRDITINLYPENGHTAIANQFIKDVFTNLIGNSIKHSQNSGPVVIDVKTERTIVDNKEYCKVNIEDNGPGIPDPRKDEVFGRFATGSAKTRGLGLGLYLVKVLVESFNGKVWVEDKVAGDHTKGCRFVVLLPMAEQ